MTPPVASDLHLRFAVDLLAAQPSTGRDNVVVSPWSVSSALAVLASACDGPARREIERALTAGRDTGSPVASLLADAAKVARTPVASEDATLTVANTLWVDQGRTPAPTLVDDLDRWPGAAVRSIPLASDPEGARAAINADVARTTRDLIPEILSAGSITTDDRAVIVNALYLLAGWFEPFSQPRTADEPFHSPSGTRLVPTMRGSRQVPYASDGWEYLAVPLARGLQAEILLPPARAPAQLETLDPTVLADLRHRAEAHRVELHLPRCRVEWRARLDGPLGALDVSRIFDPAARALTTAVVEERLYVSAAFHAAVLRVDEKGIEGAAATAIVGRAISFRTLPEVEVRADRPFILLVTDRETGVAIFLARVTDP